MHLDILQQPVWRRDARLGEVVPPPWFLLPLYPSFTYVAVALKLIVGVKSIPCVQCGEEMVVDIRLHRNLDEGKGWRWRAKGAMLWICLFIYNHWLNRIKKTEIQPLTGQSQHVQPCSACMADKPSYWPWRNLWLWLSGCEYLGLSAASSLRLQLEGRGRKGYGETKGKKSKVCCLTVAIHLIVVKILHSKQLSNFWWNVRRSAKYLRLIIKDYKYLLKVSWWSIQHHFRLFIIIYFAHS